MTLTVRSATVTGATTKGSALTHAELDENFNHLSQASNHSFTQSGNGAVSMSMQTFARQFVTPEMYGAVGDGATDDSTAWTNALARVASGGTIICAPGATYHFTSQVTADSPDNDRICIHGYGANITTAGAISGLKITGGSPTGGVTVMGLQVNHRGNADATYGFDIIQAWRAHLLDCFVEAHGVSATYAAFHIGNGTASDASTGSFWTTLTTCGCRRRSGSDTGEITIGVLLEGAANATTIQGGSYSATTCVKATVYSGETYLANGILITGAAFETYTTAVSIVGAATSNITGHRFIGNRFEDGTTVFSYSGTTTQPAQPPFFAGNHLVSNAGTYLSNANSLYMAVMDMGVTPDAQFDCTQEQAFKFRATSGTEHAAVFRPGGGSRGVVLQNSSGSTCADLLWSGTGTGARLRGVSSGLALMHIKSISNGATEANNLRGQVTFASAATKAVSFGTAESDATYFVVITGDVDENFWVTSKATTGFTINSSNATSTAVVDWVLIR
jgi:hypothetical protein